MYYKNTPFIVVKYYCDHGGNHSYSVYFQTWNGYLMMLSIHSLTERLPAYTGNTELFIY